MQADPRPNSRRIAMKTLVGSITGAALFTLFRPRAAYGQTRPTLASLEARINALEANLAALNSTTNNLIAPGTICCFAGSTPVTSDWLLCDGALASRTTYANLFGVIGETYGRGNGSTTFALPDLRGRTAVGVDGMAIRLISHPGGTQLGGSGGSATYPLSVSNLPAHSHQITDPGHKHPIRSANDDFSGTGGPIPGIQRIFDHGSYVWDEGSLRADYTGTNISIQATGSGQPHENMPPFLTLNWIVKT